jgi:hypothetical protein
MAKLCDRCDSKDASTVDVRFMKAAKPNTKTRARCMIESNMDLCEPCITDLLCNFGKFKVKFLRDGDEPDSDTDNAGGS